VTTTDKDLGMKAIIAEMKKLGRGEVVVGILQDKGAKRYEGPGTQPTTLDVAIWNEFGTDDVPERPAHRLAFERNRAELEKRMELTAKAVGGKTTKAMSAERGLDLLGVFYEAKVKQEIVDLRVPPNAPRTIAEKKSDNPLIHTSQMVNSVTYEKRFK
jgi:hypothetical protein